MAKKVLIIGGVAGGASAAARLRRLDEHAEIILFERGQYISFANCGLPYYIGNVISERDYLLVQTEESMEARFHIDVRPEHEVVAIDRGRKEVEVIAKGERYRESYDYLILSPGAEPLVPPIPGIDHPSIYTVRNMNDIDKIHRHIQQVQPQKSVVIGGGYVGIEMAENLRELGQDVTVIEAGPNILAPFDFEMARMLEKTLHDHGIPVITNDAVTAFAPTAAPATGSGDKSHRGPVTLTLKSGQTLTADLVILAVGVRPENKLAREAGLDIGERGGIKVDPYLRTSDPSIYAVGDAIEVKDRVNGAYSLIPLAGPANKQGRIAADNICGRNIQYTGSQGSAILKVCNLTAAATGNNEKQLKRAGIAYRKSYTQSPSHAGYYPGGNEMVVKILFTPDEGKLLGAQIVGEDGVDKRIDVLATAIRHGMTVYDLAELELAYAPPYSSAKDPVNMAGFVGTNILRGDVNVVHWDELPAMDPSTYVLLDVRTRQEHQYSHPEGALLIPVDELRERIDEIPRDKKIFAFCRIGIRGYIACRILAPHGFDVYNISGGNELYAAMTNHYGETLTPTQKMRRSEGH
ncbi:FAD-dependent oxidoreductase [Heliophilum fasciatum]|uniref:NADPH-dependent 2,4-dienoyl-CoA reductase/sulfur reductase-like enzyme n=1 Tax=Heliophilum fasciatum TaxID=35700 RepID=A0A4R2RU80_9FIRM|nr:FAD-dependent oxidoreductase [Heliophilum fasciatum]MCW2278613.1 NADPH-dependent 2,4-dienoyl-CoA reductase/sulfur reductase-like enzyme [Heliophilum fasciatum]TCP62685.1 NADPH-dependent 2,4-dienoyl-CoA reductase/sulfur reductase-like enzyme [Heliophilum fasciatum]